MSDFPKLARIKQDDENMEKLHSAARRGQTELIRRLVQSGIDANIENKFGCTPLHLACKHGHISATRELASLGNPSGLWHGQKPLHLAVQSKKPDVVSALVKTVQDAGKDVASFVNECDLVELEEVGQFQKHIQGQTALHLSVGLQNKEMIKLLLSFGASATAKDKAGETPIMRAIEFNDEDVFETLITSQPAATLRLDICDKHGHSSLHWAILHNRQAMANKLLEIGHEVNGEDEEKVTPVLLAAYGAMPALLDKMLPQADPFAIQSAQFHNGLQVQPDRMPWLSYATDEALRADVVKILQKKLDQLNKEKSMSQTTTSLGATRQNKVPVQMSVAPSAPVKK